MSLLPVYESVVRGDYDYDLFNKRTLRASSAMPDSLFLRGHRIDPQTMTQRSVSVLREVVPGRSYDTVYPKYSSFDQEFDSGLITSYHGFTVPIYRRRYFPQSYWWDRPYSSSSPYSFSSSYYSDRDTYPYYSRIASYSVPARAPWRDWRTEAPYRSYSPYRPRYISPTVRSSYLYPKYV